MKIKKFNGDCEISWKWWKFIKSIDFPDSATLHETFVFLAQNQGLSGCNPQKPKDHEFPNIFVKFTRISQFPAKFLEILQKQLQNSFWRILVVPWPPHAGNLVIPIGILRFSGLPGGPETLQNAKSGGNPLKTWKFCKNHEISWNFMKFHEISWKLQFLTNFAHSGGAETLIFLRKNNDLRAGPPKDSLPAKFTENLRI